MSQTRPPVVKLPLVAIREVDWPLFEREAQRRGLAVTQLCAEVLTVWATERRHQHRHATDPAPKPAA